MKLPAPYTTNASPYQKGAGAGCDAAKGAIGSNTAHATDERDKSATKNGHELHSRQ